MKVSVKEVGYGYLLGANGEKFICDCDGYGNVISKNIGNLYKISLRDENGNVVEIESL